MNTNAIEINEKKDRKKGLLIAFFMHTGLLLIALFPLLSNLQPEQPEEAQFVTIDFSDFRPASREGAQPKKAKTTNVKKKMQKSVPTAKPVPKPKPVPVTKTKEVLTSPEPEVPVNTAPEKETTAQEAPLERPTPETAAPDATTDTDASADASEATDAPASSADSDSQNSTGAGEGKSDQSDGKADAGIDWGEVTGEGLFSRRVIYRADVRKITEEEGKIVVRLCVNRSGNVVFAQNDDATTIRDKSIVRKAIQLTTRYRFERDYTAPEKQCGKMTYIFEIERE